MVARRFQFRIRTMLGAVGLIAVYLGLWMRLGGAPTTLLVVCFAISCIGIPLQGIDRRFMGAVIVQQLGLLASVTWCLCMYHVYGLGSIVWWIWAIPLAVLSATLCASNAHRLSIVVVLAFALTASPFVVLRGDISLVIRLHNLHSEVTRIIAFLEHQKDVTGKYPADLTRYDFRRPELARYIDYQPGTRWLSEPRDSYMIDYHPLVDEGIQHWYSPTYGWGYYDD